MKFIVLGANGLAGSAFVRVIKGKGHECVELTRENYDGLKGSSCDVFVNANGNSKKFLAKQDPAGELDRSVKPVIASCVDFKFRKYILISSADVYSCQNDSGKNHEEAHIELSLLSPYGLCKRMAEQVVESMCSDWLILRCGGLIGKGLRKNPVYDILTGGTLFVDPESEFGFIDTEELASITIELIEKSVSRRIINVSGNGLVSIREVIEIAGRKDSEIKVADNAPRIRYDINNAKLNEFHRPQSSRTAIEKFIMDWKNGKH